jgi:DNA modification methylase
VALPLTTQPRPVERQPLGRADARHLPLADGVADLCVTSPPYWRKRDYGVVGQLGWEPTPEAYVAAMLDALREIARVLKPTGSLFLNLGDTYDRKSLVGIPFLVEKTARGDGWLVRNRVVWAKPRGVPTPRGDRLASRHEYVLHLTRGPDYFYDLTGYLEELQVRPLSGDVWEIPPSRHLGDHLAPFPDELVARAVSLACPRKVCRRCGRPQERILAAAPVPDPDRPQARRAVAIAKEAGLTPAHFAAIRATGIADAGKGRRIQDMTYSNAKGTAALAQEAKRVLGGYFREFTFGRRITTGFSRCRCKAGTRPGLVFDPFAGTGTVVRVARALNRRAVGFDLTVSR